MWTGKVVEARLPITRFVDGTVVYIVSKEITDLLSIYIFHIKPLPGCGSDGSGERHRPRAAGVVRGGAVGRAVQLRRDHPAPRAAMIGSSRTTRRAARSSRR